MVKRDAYHCRAPVGNGGGRRAGVSEVVFRFEKQKRKRKARLVRSQSLDQKSTFLNR